MDSRNAFDRQLTEEIEHQVGPPQGVDALEVTRQARSRKPAWRFSMSSTLKFAAAAVVLAVAGTALILAEPGAQDGDVAQPGAEPVASEVPQDEAAATEMPTGSAFFTGTYTPANPPTINGEEFTAPDGIDWMAGQVHEDEVVEASDPRLSGTLTTTLNWAFLDGNMSLLAETHGWSLENDAGSWTGEGTAIIHSAVGEPPTSFLTIELTGAGGYDGLTAVVLVDRTENPPTIEGAIVAGELLPVEGPAAE
jgi:hypothetical protein